MVRVYLPLKNLVCTEYVMRCAIWYHFHNLKNVKSTYGGVLLIVTTNDERSLQFDWQKASEQ